MSFSLAVALFYIYPLVTIGVFLFNLRHGAFIRVTLVYFVVMTFFACLLLYGSAYILDSNVSQWQHEGIFATFPFFITGGGPDKNTIPKTTSAYWLWSIIVISYFVTFPQAVLRGVRLHLEKRWAPDKITENLQKTYNDHLRPVVAFLFKKALPGLAGDTFIIGEWVFALIVLSSLVSPFPSQSWPLLLIGFVFVVLLAGDNLLVGTHGPVSNIVRRLFLPPLVVGYQKLLARLSAIMIAIIGGLLSLATLLVSGYILAVAFASIFHTSNVLVVLILALITFVIAAGLAWASFALYIKIAKVVLKALLFVPGLLMRWMEADVGTLTSEFKTAMDMEPTAEVGAVASANELAEDE